MITVFKSQKAISNEDNEAFVELRGLSTDEKPTTVEGSKVGNGSSFIEIDTQKIAFYDGENEEWKEVE